MIVRDRIASTSIAGNLLGDPSERDLFVYLPPGYGSGNRRYASVYLLHWFGVHAADLISPPEDKARWSPPLEDVLDPVFQRMGTKEMIVVIPDGWTSYGCSQWVDSPVNGDFEQYVLHEVVPHIDKHYSTIERSESRGVLGSSSGGFGAWHLASRNPTVFGAMAVLSGDSYFDLTHKPMVYNYYSSIFPDRPTGPDEKNPESQMAYALAACYSPNPDNPPYYVDFPVDYPTGRLLQPTWERWLSYDMVVNWRSRSSNLSRLRGILLDVGWRDEHALQWGHRILSADLASAGLPHEVVEHAGDHGGRSRERHQLALRWLADKLEHE
jgi:S-formylglutathione hydrolase FrmB